MKMWKVRSGRFVLGTIKHVGVEGFVWRGTGKYADGDSGITDSLENAALRILKDNKMSPRQYVFSVDPV